MERAFETVRLAAALREEGGYVVGVELSGNPTRGHFSTFLPAFEEARRWPGY